MKLHKKIKSFVIVIIMVSVLSCTMGECNVIRGESGNYYQGKTFQTIPFNVKEIESNTGKKKLGVEISWDGIEEYIMEYITYSRISYIDIYKKTADEEFEFIRELGAYDRYVDNDVKRGKKYYYKIVIVCANNNIVTSSVKSVMVRGIASAPKLKMSYNSKKWKIKWGILNDYSKGIEIYLKTGKGKYKKYKLLKRIKKIKKSEDKTGITGIEGKVKGLEKGVKYKFKARTFTKIKGKRIYSKWSKVKTIRIV